VVKRSEVCSASRGVVACAFYWKVYGVRGSEKWSVILGRTAVLD
jgi:hypothetical protein